MGEGSVVRKSRTTAKDGKTYNVKYYNLDMIVAIGFRVKSNVGTNFRIWANEKLTEYIQKGFIIKGSDRKRQKVKGFRKTTRYFETKVTTINRGLDKSMADFEEKMKTITTG